MFTDIKKLKTFVAIVEEESFTGAAERLNMAQPWVSVQLKQLEDALDLVLIERSKGKLVKLSPNGHEFLPIAKRLLNHCEDATREMHELRNRDRAKFVLGVDPITIYMPERNALITQFMSRMPETELEILVQPPFELFEGLRNGRFDIILTSFPNPDEDVETLPLCDYDLQLYVPKQNAERYRISTQDGLNGAKILTLPDDYHPGIFSWLKESLAPLNVHWTRCPETSVEALIHYASMLGIATLVPDFSTSIRELNTQMVPQSIKDHKLTVRWGLMRRQGYRRKAPERFWKLADQMCATRIAHAA